MGRNWGLVLVLLYCIGRSSTSNAECPATCDDANALNAQFCEDFFRLAETALLSNGSNLYKLRKMFLNRAPPELVNVTYYVQLSNNGSASFDCSPCTDECTEQWLLNTTGTVTLRYGWTSIGMYTLIYPALLNQLQIQLPLVLMRIDVAGAFPFLWNGYNQLPSINLHLSIPTENLSCLPSNSQVDGVMKTLTSLLEFYATRELPVGDRQIISAEADYAIDGQYVSNWPWIDLPNECKNSSWDNCTNTSFIPLNSNIIKIKEDRLETIQDMTVFSTPIIGLALFYLLHKLLLQKRSNIRDKNSQSFALLIGFLLSTITLGFVLIVAELLSWENRPTDLDIINIKHSTIFAFTALFVVCELIFVIVFDERINPFKHTEMKLLYTILIYIIYFLIAIFLFYFFYFALLWIIASSFATLLFSLAYPVYVITLVVLHIAFVFVVSIFFAVIVSEVILWFTFLKKRTSIKYFLDYGIIIFCCLISYLFFGCLYLGIIWGYASTIVQRIVPAEGVVQGLLFLPSLILFAVGWLLKRKFFVTGIPEQRKIVNELHKITFPKEKRTEFGKHLGIPSDDLYDIELRAIYKDDPKRAALTEMIYYWYERQRAPSLAALMDILEHKMDMDLAWYKDRMREGKVSQLGRCVEEEDFDELIKEFGQNLVDTSKLAEKLNIGETIDYEPNNYGKTQSQLRHLLKIWINKEKENAIWGLLIRKMQLIDKEAAKKIKAMRCKFIDQVDQVYMFVVNNS